MNKSFFVNEILSHQSDKIACVNHLNQTLRYSELNQMVIDIERFFANYPLIKHKRYGFFTEDAFSLFPLVLGCLENIVLVPIDSQIPIEQFKEICEQYHLSGLISPNRSHPFYLEAENRKISLIHYELNQTIKLTLDQSYLNENKIEKDLAFIISTTGTTDQAKRIMIGNNAYMRQVLHEAQYYHFDSNIVHVISTKPSRYVSTFIGFRVLYAGGTLCISTSYQARVILEWIKQYRNINISMTPSGLLPLIEESKRQSYKHTSGLIQIFLSGSSVTQNLCDLFANHFNVRFIYNYGSSETGAISSTYFQTSFIPYSVGLLMIDHNSIRIQNEEIQIKTNNLFLGYEGINRSEYMYDDWFKTGDSGYLDETNNLFIVGRIKEIINRGGDKISPFQIESKLSLNESILDCVVFPITNKNGFDDIACAVVLKDGYSFDLKMCREYLRKWFIPYHCPSVLIKIDEIPSNENGKIQRYKLQEIFKDEIICLTQENEKSNDENVILRLACLYLNKPTLEFEDNFYDMGGDSLKASELISHIEFELKRKLDLSEFIKNPVLMNLNQFMQVERIFTVCLNANGNKPPLICIHSGDGDALNYRFIAQQIQDRPIYAVQYKQKEVDLYPFNQLEEMVSYYIKDLIDINGPFHILGDCLGGGIAYEYAQQILKKGGEVGLLMMLDTPRKGIVKSKKTFFNRFKLKLVRNLRNISINPYELLNSLIYAYKKMKEWFISRQNSNHFRNHILRLYRDYIPKNYPRSIVYVQAIKECRDEDQIYWKNLTNDFSLIKMQCRHGEFLTHKHSKELVDYLNLEMEKYE